MRNLNGTLGSRGLFRSGLLAAITCVGLCTGCRAHPVGLAVMMIGDVVDDADVRSRTKQLVGERVGAADRTLGSRYDTLTEMKTGGQWVIYKDAVMDQTYYVVRSFDGRIESLTKAREDADGFEDVVERLDLESKLIGKTPSECRATVNLPDATDVLLSARIGGIMRIYNVRDWTNTRGARYCLLEFDANDRCRNIRMIGVTAASNRAEYQR